MLYIFFFFFCFFFYLIFFFFFNDTATTEIYTLSLHDALPIPGRGYLAGALTCISARNASSRRCGGGRSPGRCASRGHWAPARSESIWRSGAGSPGQDCPGPPARAATRTALPGKQDPIVMSA